jgi:hypothetical protein
MRNQIRVASPEMKLARVLVALEPELVAATDAEIEEAAADLGMKLDMQGSVAFAGLKFPAKVRFQDYFGPDALARIRELLEARQRTLGRRDDDKKDE